MIHVNTVFADKAARRVLVLGTFSLTGATVPRHAARVMVSLAGQGFTPVSVAPDQTPFAETNIGAEDVLHGADMAVVYLRSYLRKSHKASWTKSRPYRVMRLVQLAQNARRTVLICSTPKSAFSRCIQSISSRILRRLFGGRICLSQLRTPPERLVAQLTGTVPTVVDPIQAETATFQRILRQRPGGMRLSTAHVARALAAGHVSLRLTLELENLDNIVQKLTAEDVKKALNFARTYNASNTPAAIRPCLEMRAAAAPLLRIGEHMRLTGARGKALKQFIMQPIPDDRRTTHDKLVLKFLRAGHCNDRNFAHWLTQPLATNRSTLTRLQWIMVRVLRLPMKDIAAFNHPWACESWEMQLQAYLPPILCPPGKADKSALTLHGLTSDTTGLGQNLSMTCDALSVAGVPYQMAGAAAPRRDPKAAYEMTRPVSIHHLNADRIPQEIFAHYRYRESFHIGFLLWELDRLPKEHRLAMEMLDEIWVPSVYLMNLYQSAFRGKVILMRKGMPDLYPTSVPRTRGIKRFVVCFDANSSASRKNPLAAVRAFQQAFFGRDDCELIVKTTPTQKNHWGDPENQLAAIRDVAARDPRIQLITEYWAHSRLLGVIASADCLISPHRSEGFGYIPAYAQALGTPVVVTDYAGTRDFCTQATSFPVPYQLVPVKPGQSIHDTKNANWAEICHRSLCETLCLVDAQPALAQKRADLAQQRIKAEYSIHAQGLRYTTRLNQLGLLRATIPQNGQLETFRFLETA